MVDGQLILDATRTSTSGTAQFSSGSVSTYGLKNFNGGYLEARIWLPDTPGSWPAFWGLYDGWPPEMDIMEYPIDTAAGSGYAQDEYHTAFHYTNSSGSAAAGAGKVNPSSAGDLGGAWHHFGAHWVEDSSVTFYFDGQAVSSFNSAADVAEMVSMYLILDYAVGGWPGTPSTTEWPLGFSDQTRVDWVRVWQAANSKTSNWAATGTDSYQLWDSAANWTQGIPNLGGVTSSFGTVPGAAEHRIDWSGSRSLSVIQLDGTTRYRFGWPNDRLILGFGDGGAIQPAITVAATTTQSHQVDGVLEWSGDLTLFNASTQPLVIAGQALGGNGITINGSSLNNAVDDSTGLVIFEGANTFSGTTTLDSGTAGNAVARARGDHSLGYGQVVIGPVGNNTTARLELENDCLLPNPLILGGRPTSNPSVGIRNQSGTNTLSGTLTGQFGGSEFRLESTAGELRMHGDPAVTFTATGTRHLILQGSGDGLMGGGLENGSATTVNLLKSGSGRWTLAGDCQFTGTTTVDEGTLVVEGQTGSGATQLATGTTLAGGGTVQGSLQASPGSTIRVGAIGFAPAFETIDDFNSYPTGDIGAVPNSTGDVWTGVFNGTANADIVSESGNLSLAVQGTNAANGWRGAVSDLKNAHSRDFSLADGKTGTYFFRVKSANPSTTDFIFGLTEQPASTTSAPGNDIADPWNEYAITLSIANGQLRGYSEGSGDVAATSLAANQWLNVWVIVDNSSKTYQIATSLGTADGTLASSTFAFGRHTGATVGSQSLVTFGAHERVNVLGQIDDLSFASGVVLANPLAAVAPVVASTLTVQGSMDLPLGATLQLDLGSPNQHDRLVVGGSLQASGKLEVAWDASAESPAAGDLYPLVEAPSSILNFDSVELPSLPADLAWDTSRLSEGILQVIEAPTGYAAWAAEFDFPGGSSGAEADPDGDHLANVIEWLFGTSPLQANTLEPALWASLQSADSLALEGGEPYLTLTARMRKEHPGFVVIPEGSGELETLGTPESAARVHPVGDPVDDGDFETRTWYYEIPIPSAQHGFMRLRIVEE